MNTPPDHPKIGKPRELVQCRDCGLVTNDAKSALTTECNGRPHDFNPYPDGRYRAGWEAGYQVAVREGNGALRDLASRLEEDGNEVAAAVRKLADE